MGLGQSVKSRAGWTAGMNRETVGFLGTVLIRPFSVKLGQYRFLSLCRCHLVNVLKSGI